MHFDAWVAIVWLFLIALDVWLWGVIAEWIAAMF
jgi:hypothetical protein